MFGVLVESLMAAGGGGSFSASAFLSTFTGGSSVSVLVAQPVAIETSAARTTRMLRQL